MAEIETQKEENTQSGGKANPQKRERSTIEFPYGDLEEAEKVAIAIHEEHGLSCETYQLAASLGQTVTSGTFRLRVASASTFGLTINEAKHVRLTDLGREIINEDTRFAARVRAFLTVPLYSAVFEHFKGHSLPPAAGLEAELVKLGVAPKQKDKARQVLMRSAMHAGFFAHGKDRLVEPSNARISTVSRPAETNGGSETDAGGSGAPPITGPRSTEIDPIIQHMVSRLPPPDTDFPLENRVRWLEALARTMEVIYPKTGDGRVKITVESGD